MEQFINPNEKMTPEKMQEIGKTSEELSNTFNDLEARLNQHKAEFAAAEGGMTPELEAYYQNQKMQYLEEMDAVEDKLTAFQEVVEEAKEVAEVQVMASVEAILRKMLLAAEKDPSLRAEVNEWVESYKQAFGKEDIFGV